MDEDKKDSELRLLYKITIDDIRYAKARQWAIIFFTLLGFAGIMGFLKISEAKLAYFYWFQRPFLALLAFFINVLGIYLLMVNRRVLHRYIMRLTAIKDRFYQDTQDIIGISPIAEEADHYIYWRYYWLSIFPFILIIVAGLLCVALILVRFHPLIILAIVLIINIPLLIYLHISNKREIK